jgi:ribose transport system substrate-binding protein
VKKIFTLILAIAIATVMLAACAEEIPTVVPEPETLEIEAPVNGGPIGEPMYIAVVSTGFRYGFWQAVYAGARNAGEELGVEVFIGSPESEADVEGQVDILDAQLARNPDAIALAAIDTLSVLVQLQDAYNREIPVVGFDSGVPRAPAGQIAATAGTNNEVAAALAAQIMFMEISSSVADATETNPVIITILSQDATSESIAARTRGFAQEMYAFANRANDRVAITGELLEINTGDTNAAVRINVVIGDTPDIADMASAAAGILNTNNLAGLFMTSEGAVNGFLDAIDAGSALPDGVIAVGFDAGSAQKDAVRAGLIFGSITQDPVQIGFQAVRLAVMAARGESVFDIDTGAQWWDANNMDDPAVAALLYD